mmetsp:Transcript_3523/g.9171  ORF Transcript_3523/g.9171 Transcript_3523/m.9171 type:complete len:405 (-) Transcript_3523:251-1465(-)
MGPCSAKQALDASFCLRAGLTTHCATLHCAASSSDACRQAIPWASHLDGLGCLSREHSALPEASLELDGDEGMTRRERCPPEDQEDVLDVRDPALDMHSALLQLRQNVRMAGGGGASSTVSRGATSGAASSLSSSSSSTLNSQTRGSSRTSEFEPGDRLQYRSLSLLDDLWEPDLEPHISSGLPSTLGYRFRSSLSDFDADFGDEVYPTQPFDYGQNPFLARRGQRANLHHSRPRRFRSQRNAAESRAAGAPAVLPGRHYDDVYADDDYSDEGLSGPSLYGDGSVDHGNLRLVRTLLDLGDHVPIRAPPPTQAQLAMLPSWKHVQPSSTASDNQSNATSSSAGRSAFSRGCDCAICQGDYLENEELKRLPCFHTFHAECIDKWLTGGMPSATQCPICMSEVDIF